MPCNETCETCTGLEKCATCPEGFNLGDTICLTCAANEFISGDECENCGINCLACSSGPDLCTQCNSDTQLEDGTCVCKNGTFLDSEN